MTVHHDHSLRRALNRGADFKEGEQSEFVEDHGFLIETSKVATIIDPSASFTLEYLDMIMTIRANRWKALFVPTARLEFRVTEFSWRDIPYFMYKRSEATAHGTRDYLMAKWQANFPNTGFWTYIKYTIVEQHVYGGRHVATPPANALPEIHAQAAYHRDVLRSMKWKDQALLVFGFFQMVGYNRYSLNEGAAAGAFSSSSSSGGASPDRRADFLDMLAKLDRGWTPSSRTAVRASRKLGRPPITKTRPAYVSHLDEILPYGVDSRVEAEIEHEYLPFSLAKLTLGSCEALTPEAEAVCGIVVDHAGESCDCWINMPTFKSNSLFVRLLSRFAALIKVPSRVTTFVEMALSAGRNGTEHVLPLRPNEGTSPHGAQQTKRFELVTCDIDEVDCQASFGFGKASRLTLFRGAPATVAAVQAALESLERA